MYIKLDVLYVRLARIGDRDAAVLAACTARVRLRFGDGYLFVLPFQCMSLARLISPRGKVGSSPTHGFCAWVGVPGIQYAFIASKRLINTFLIQYQSEAVPHK